MTSIIIFITSLISIIAIGMQTRAIAKNQKFIAAFSAAIFAMGSVITLKLVPQSSSYFDYFSYVFANFIGILYSFKLHNTFTLKNEFKKPFDFCNNRERKCEFREDGLCSESRDGCPVYITFIKKENINKEMDSK